MDTAVSTVATRLCLSLPLPSFNEFSKIKDDLQRFNCSRFRCGCSSSMTSSSLSSSSSDEAASSQKWVEFSHLSACVRSLMEGVSSMVDSELASELTPSLTPADVRFFQNADASSKGSVNIRSGTQASKIDYVLGSWLNCNLPSGVLNISTIMGMVNSSIDAPHIVFEVIQSRPTAMTLILDLIPRKDMVLEPEYLQRFYQDTQLDIHRQALEKLPQSRPYISPFLFQRVIVSPTAIELNLESQIKDSDGKQESMDEIIKNKLEPVVQEVFKIWFKSISKLGKPTEKHEQQILLRRDNSIKEMAIEIDLRSNLPRLFGQDVADRVIAAIRNKF